MNEADELDDRLRALRRTLVGMRPPGGERADLINHAIFEVDNALRGLRRGEADDLYSAARCENDTVMIIGALQSM